MFVLYKVLPTGQTVFFQKAIEGMLLNTINTFLADTYHNKESAIDLLMHLNRMIDDPYSLGELTLDTLVK